MTDALIFGLIASIALVAGPLIGVRWQVPRPVIATLLALASGALITALSFELFGESFRTSGVVPASIGFLIGAGVFVALKELIDHQGKRSGSRRTGLALLGAVTLDGVPENLALGATLAGAASGSVPLLAAIFLSNFPEALVSTERLKRSGYEKRSIVLIWVGAAVLLAASVVVGDALLAKVDESVRAVCLAFASGAVLASLAATLMPEAYREGGTTVAFATAAGFLMSFLLNEI